ncbi:MAG: hypothetical protein R6V29_09285 [Spirochaetia bacterium]
MKKSFVVIFLAILSTLPGFSQPSGSPESRGRRLVDHYREIRSLHPRLEGSSGEERTLRYIEEVSSDHDLDVDVQDFSNMEDAHSFSRNARVDLPGSESGRVFLLVPLNHGVGKHADNDHSVSLAAALTVMEEAAAETRDGPSLSIVFLGAEGDGRLLGTRLLLQSIASEDVRAALYLDVAAAGGLLSAELGADGNAAPRRLAEHIVRALSESDVPHRQYPTSLQISRSRLAGGSVLSAYLDQQVPAVRIHQWATGAQDTEPLADLAATADATAEGEESPAHSGGISREWASAFVSFLFDSFDRTAPLERGSWDRHYVYGRTGEIITFLGEEAYLVLLLIVLSSPVVYGLVFQRSLRRYVRLVTHNIWTILVLLALTFFFFFLATAIIRGVLDFREFPTLWQYAPGQYFLLKLLIAIFLFAFVFHSLRGLPFPRRGSFYSASAIFLLFLDIVLLSLFDISFTFYFLWALVAAFLFSLSRRVWLKAALLLAAPLWIIIGVVELFAAGELQAAEALLLSPVAGNLIFAVVLLPFLLMLIRVDLMLHHHFRFPRGSTLKITVFGSAAAVVLFAAALVYLEPFNEERPQPVEAVEVIDQEAHTHSLELTSPAPLEGLEVRHGSQHYRVQTTERTHTIELPGQPHVVSLTEDTREFLSRRQVLLTIDSSLPPEEIELSLESEDELLIYDSNFPYEGGEQDRQQDGRQDRKQEHIDFAVGLFPPNPLQLSFTVPGETETAVRIRLHSQETTEELESTEDAFRLHTRTRVIRGSAP